MPYDNAYNRMIADDIMSLNKKYLEHEKLTGQGMSGGFLGALAGMIIPSVVSAVANKVFGSGMSGGVDDSECKCDENVAECVCGDAKQYGEGMSAGKKKRGRKPKMAGGALGSDAGFASGTFMDTGFDRTIGAGMSAGVKKYVKKRSRMGCSGGAKKLLNAKQKMQGEGLVGDLVGTVGSLFGLAKPKRGRKSKTMTGGTELGLPTSIAGAGMSAGKKRGRKPKTQMQGEGLLSGIGGIVDDLFGFGSSGGIKKRGRKSKMAGGVKLTPVANMKASYMTGQGRSGAGSSGGKRVNKRAEMVKQVMKDRGLSMIEASKYITKHELYKK